MAPVEVDDDDLHCDEWTGQSICFPLQQSFVCRYFAAYPSCEEEYYAF